MATELKMPWDIETRLIPAAVRGVVTMPH